MINKIRTLLILASMALGLLVVLPAQAQTIANSRNWAGYVSQNGSFTSVSGSWVIPTVTGTGQTSADAEWVGIGGVGGEDLIQSGTQAIVDSSGQVSYEAFWETLPQVSQPIPLTVKPGDAVSVSVSEQAPNQWLIAFNDLTTGQNYSTNVNYVSSHSSAEWIEEAPAIPNGFLPLDNFGTVQFSSGKAIENGQTVTIAGSGASVINMLNNNQQSLATISGLGGDAASFSVTRTSTSSSSPGGQYIITHGRGWRRGGSGINRQQVIRSIGYNRSGFSISIPQMIFRLNFHAVR